MAAPRILAGRGFFDKLPYWLALPAGAFLGLVAGYRASAPGAGPKRVLFAFALLGAVALLGAFAPRPARRRLRRFSDRTDEPAASGERAPDRDVGTDDSLCD